MVSSFDGAGDRGDRYVCCPSSHFGGGLLHTPQSVSGLRPLRGERTAEEVGDTRSEENNHSPEVLTASTSGHLLDSLRPLFLVSLYYTMTLYK